MSLDLCLYRGQVPERRLLSAELLCVAGVAERHPVAPAAPEEHPRDRVLGELLLRRLHVEVEDRRDVEREELGHQEAADDREAEGRRAAVLAPMPSAIGSVPSNVSVRLVSI